MAKPTASRPATIADVQRLVNKAAVSGSAKGPAKAKRNKSGPRDAPIAIGSTLTLRGPSNVAASAGNTRIRNTEFVSDITTSPTVPIVGFDLNPASSGLFTWLGRIASGFELFKFHKLTFTYTPICTTSTPGVVIMAFDYDASDLPPTNKQIMSAYSGSTRTNVWNKLTCDLKPPAGWFYTGLPGTGSINPGNTDIKFYDVAKFYLAIFNANPSVTVGELTVTYDVEFSKPEFGPVNASEAIANFASSSLSNLAGTGYSTVGPIIANVSSAGAGLLALDFVIPGSYLIEVCAQCSTNSSATNVFLNSTQTDPGGQAVTVPWAEFATTGWTNSSGVMTALNLIIVQTKATTRLVIAAASLVNAMNMFRLRIAPYSQI